jgi:adenylate kinase
MKKAVEYLKDLFEEPLNLEEGGIEDDFLKVIKQVQLDVIDYVAERCANEAKADIYIVDIHSSYKDYALVDKSSILDIADKIKEELK